MPDFYRLTSTTNRHTDGTTEIVLDVNDRGEATKVVSTGIPVQMTADERKLVESLGYSLDSVSKEEAEEAKATGGFANDTSAAAPTFVNAGAANQKTDK